MNVTYYRPTLIFYLTYTVYLSFSMRRERFKKRGIFKQAI